MSDPGIPSRNPPEHFQVAEGYGCYRPVGRFSHQEAVDLISAAIAFARENRIGRLLVDCTHLTECVRPETWQRFEMGSHFATEARSSVILALVAKAEFIDPDGFGVKVARNRGLLANVFASEPEALAWLLDPQTRQGSL